MTSTWRHRDRRTTTYVPIYNMWNGWQLSLSSCTMKWDVVVCSGCVCLDFSHLIFVLFPSFSSTSFRIFCLFYFCIHPISSILCRERFNAIEYTYLYIIYICGTLFSLLFFIRLDENLAVYVNIIRYTLNKRTIFNQIFDYLLFVRFYLFHFFFFQGILKEGRVLF